MLFVPPSSLDSAEEVCGDYTRERLEAMDAAFVAAVELAFAKGLESRVAAAASVRVGYTLMWCPLGCRRSQKEAPAATGAGLGGPWADPDSTPIRSWLGANVSVETFSLDGPALT